MDFPKQGMYFEQVRERLRKYDKVKLSNENLVNSMIGQVKVAEGVNAANELAKEFVSPKTEGGTFLTGKGNKQSGIGNGVKGSSGHYEFIKGKGWIRT